MNPEALRLAEILDEEALMSAIGRREHLDYRAESAGELRRLHAANAALTEALREIEAEATVFGNGFGSWVAQAARAAIAQHGAKQ